MTVNTHNIEFKVRCLDKEGVIVHEFEKEDVQSVKEIFLTLESQLDNIIDIKEKDKSIYLININTYLCINGCSYKLSDIHFIKDEDTGGFVQIEAMMLNGLSVMLNMSKEQLTAARMGLTKTNNTTTPSGIII